MNSDPFLPRYKPEVAHAAYTVAGFIWSNLGGGVGSGSGGGAAGDLEALLRGLK